MRSRSTGLIGRRFLLCATLVFGALFAGAAAAQTCDPGCDPEGEREAACLDRSGVWDPEQCLCFIDPGGECDPEDPCCEDPECCGDPCCFDPCCGDPCCDDPCCGDPCCEDPECCDDPECCGDPCCFDPCCGDPCCEDPCCDDPCCGDPCCGDPCCDDPCCGDPCCEDPECCDDPECCGDLDPCCGDPDPCCGDPDPCCGEEDPCCGDPDCCGDPCCGDPCCADVACWDGSCGPGLDVASATPSRARPPVRTAQPRTASQRGILYPTLAELVKRSELVVVGIPVKRPQAAAKGRSTGTSSFAVKVQEVLKGELRNGLVIRVSTPAGAPPSAGRTSGLAPGQLTLLPNQSQVLFLVVHRAARDTTYELVGGREGLFPLNTRDGVVHLGGRWPDDPVAREYARRPQRWLLNDVRLLARKAQSK